jgi:hypothetical protein
MITFEKLKKYPHKLGWFYGYDRLSDIHSEWIKYIWTAKEDRALQAFRGSYKTTALIIIGTIWYLLFNPDDRILLARKDYTNAADALGEIIRLYKRQETLYLYDKLYGIKNFELTVERKDMITLPTKTKNTKEGSITACGIKTSIVGRHYDRILNDDIITEEDRASKAERKHTARFIRELVNIIDPGKPQCFIGTPWHPDDGWTLLPTPKKYQLGSVQIVGLTPEIIAKKKARTTSSLWAANYELKHIADEDRIFPDPQCVDWPEEARPVAWLDPAYSGKNTTALTMIAKYNQSIYVRGWVWPNDVQEVYGEIIEVLKKYKNGTLYDESNADKGYSARDLRNGTSEREPWPVVIERHEKENKHIKIVSYAKQYWQDLYFATDCQADYINQILDYREGEEPDDAPDSLASLLREMGFGKETDPFKAWGL